MSKRNDYPAQRRAAVAARGGDSFGVGTIRAPRGLSKAAKRIFREYADYLTNAGVLREVDQFALGEFSKATAECAELESEIATKGRIYKGPNGGDVFHPLLGVLKESRRRAREWADRLGLSPKARTTLKQFPQGREPTKEEQDQMELFLQGKSWNQADDPIPPAASQ